LSHNEISDYNGSGLLELRQLSLSCNRLCQFPDLSSHSKLRQLRLNGNQIMQLPKDKNSFPLWLEILDLGNNQIEKLSNIKGLINCTRLRNLNLKGNPVCNTPQYKEALCALIPTLRILDGQPLNPKKKHIDEKDDLVCKEESKESEPTAEQKKRKVADMEDKPNLRKEEKENRPVEIAKDISGVIKVINTKRTKTAIDPSNLIVESAEILGWD
jgi:Leucine-rich repeat (LRR) protein